MRSGISWLDFKLAARMLVKYPGLTLVGGVGMAVAIAIGAAFFDISQAYMDTMLPLDEGERVVAVQNWNSATGHRDLPWLDDFAAWREQVRSFEVLGAFRPHWRNLVTPDGRAEPVQTAEITASGFRVARVPPLLGRHLVPEDERAGAPPVVVIGYDVWRTRFGGDPAAVGRPLQLGDTRYTVVGVMPEGFAFPVNHRFWTPLRVDPANHDRGEESVAFVFGRLAPGVTEAGAQAELDAVGRRRAAEFPQTHERLLPRVVPYTYPLVGLDDDGDRAELHLMQLFVSLLLVVVCANVAILVYARTANREGEITVRSALGASRRRIVGQLFVEALVLAGAAAAVGLLLARMGLGQARVLVEQQMSGGAPFWMDFRLSLVTVLYVVGLTVLAALIAGVVPAVKATGSRLQSGLRQLGGGTGIRLGKTWTALIVAQVAFAVAVLPAAVFTVWDSLRHAAFEPGFAAGEYLTTQVGMDRGDRAAGAAGAAEQQRFASRYAALVAELERRLEAEPGVSAVTVMTEIPGPEPTAYVEVDGAEPAAGSGTGRQVRRLRVDAGFFDAFDARMLAGRQFYSGEADTAATAVVVNQRFAEQLLGGGNAVGRRVRYVATRDQEAPPDVREGRWYEIVGVVSNLPAAALEPRMPEARLYHPLAPGQVYPVRLALRMRGGAPAAYDERLREIATSLDPNLRLHDILPLDEVYRQQQVGTRLTGWAFALVTMSVLLLSAAGIYALMSLTVARRRREIGIRSALGAPPRQILTAVFSRALAQLGAGVAVGIAAAALLERLSGGGVLNGRGAVLLPVVAALMMAVGLFAAVGPARRSLRIEPTEALREG
ncbi:MAG TPA: ABC transporter permease [Longimicrobium sp.]|jgi:predicted permease